MVKNYWYSKQRCQRSEPPPEHAPQLDDEEITSEEEFEESSNDNVAKFTTQTMQTTQTTQTMLPDFKPIEDPLKNYQSTYFRIFFIFFHILFLYDTPVNFNGKMSIIIVS